MNMTKFRYMLYTIAAALMKAAESIKDSADNVPASADADVDGVIDGPTTETTNTAPPAVDSAGLPWDERIHSGGKSVKVDGTWTKKKGATPPVVATVEAELRAKMASVGNPPAGLPTLGAPGVSLPQLGGLGAPALTNYQKLVAYLAGKTGPGKAADDAWVAAAFAGWGMTTGLPGLATDEANSALVLAEFKKVLGE